jgi:transcriptional regulator with XRE-family HTH domain
MTTKNKYNRPSADWLLNAAEFEDKCRSVSAGGMASDLGMIAPSSIDSHHVFGRLIEYARRMQGLSVEKLAEVAEVDLAEIVDIETQDVLVPQVRTVFQLADVLKLPKERLMEVAGLATPRPEVRSAALKFAARSEPTSGLSPEERVAFEEFVKVLVEVTDRG